jgi:hypothetical protein
MLNLFSFSKSLIVSTVYVECFDDSTWVAGVKCEGRYVLQDNCACADNGSLAYVHPWAERGTREHSDEVIQLYASRDVGSWRYVHPVSQYAFMIDSGAGVDDTTSPHLNIDTYSCLRQYLRASADHSAMRDKRRAMQSDERLEAGRFQTFLDLHADATMVSSYRNQESREG